MPFWRGAYMKRMLTLIAAAGLITWTAATAADHEAHERASDRIANDGARAESRGDTKGAREAREAAAAARAAEGRGDTRGAEHVEHDYNAGNRPDHQPSRGP